MYYPTLFVFPPSIRVIDREFDYCYSNPSSVVNVYIHPEEVGHDVSYVVVDR